MIEMLKEKSVAESTITVPVGIQMLKSNQINGMMEMDEANVSDLHK